MNISIFIGSSVALFGIFGIAVFWYKIMMEYNERRGMFFVDFDLVLLYDQHRTLVTNSSHQHSHRKKTFKEQFNIRIIQLKRDYQRADQTMV